ncbi:MAG TPA: transporter substrate-binding domain-containing protein [Bacteroidales bacterium]|nr:transporter substrate-binding domain-containing protein [Bacteroidales bacterium]HPR57951.1 transporter substrate-binding domain-containing protein [Bacteroidales bacterium]HRW97214.1 transporter substrate-binding domain-containing protein [Bacteroidales bacterium]
MKYLIVLFFALLFLFIPQSCDYDLNDENNLQNTFNLKDRSLDRVLKRGTLKATTDYNSTNYFIYRGEPAGYQFELLRAYAMHLGVNLELVVNNDISDALNDLWTGNVDLIAHGMTITGKRNKLVDFTIPLGQTHQVLVQRRSAGIKPPVYDDTYRGIIRNPIDLAGKMVFVPRNSAYAERLRNLQEEIGHKIFIVEFPRDTEQLIEMVASGEIDYTVCDQHIARVNSKYHPNIDIETPLSFPQNFAWAVNVGDESLKKSLDTWLESYLSSSQGKYVYNKYFVYPRSFQSAYRFSTAKNGKISDWDDFIKEKSQQYDLDWRLVTSLIYQESRFQPDASSWMGAFGLMQLMPETAEMLGIDSTSTPEEHIEAGMKYLKQLDSRFKDIIHDDDQRLKFVLAAYNAGLAHVFDARRLAIKYNKNPNVWEDNVDYFILNKSDPKYYKDSVVFYGYLRGDESYHYVKEILNRYEHYKNVTE